VSSGSFCVCTTSILCVLTHNQIGSLLTFRVYAVRVGRDSKGTYGRLSLLFETFMNVRN
jgi:hypothetical protein